MVSVVQLPAVAAEEGIAQVWPVLPDAEMQAGQVADPYVRA